MNGFGRARILVAMTLVVVGLLGLAAPAQAATCKPTGFYRDGRNMTAALVNPVGTVSGEVNATGCNIGVYYNTSGSVSGANIHGANYFGVLVDGDSQNATVNVINSKIHDIGEVPLNGSQHGVALYYRAFFSGTTAGKISGNQIWNYQKGGIVTNGIGTTVTIQGNNVAGQGAVSYIAQNGIQVGYGAIAQVMRNTVSGNSYSGRNYAASGGIIVVGGAGYGACPDGNDCPYTTGTIIQGNTVTGNDIGIWLSNLDANWNPPSSETNVKVVNNVISNDGLHNISGGSYPALVGYQAGIADQGFNDKLINNQISGIGYDPSQQSATFYSIWIDADASFTNKAKVHANKID